MRTKQKGPAVIYWLTKIAGIGPVTMGAMAEYSGTYETIYHIEGKEFLAARILTERQMAAFDGAKGNFQRCLEEYERLGEQGIFFVTVLEDAYPKRLMNIYGHPKGVYVKGRLPSDQKPSAAIVGARNCSSYGKQTAELFGQVLGRHGIQVISGMALGVDGASHEGALSAGGDTFGVLGCGVDICYPRRHMGLYKRIGEQGGLLSEFPLGEPPAASNFPMRNRLISGLADAVIVVEAKARSGSLITAELALEQGRDVFAVPGMITEELSRGCNRLIQDGAFIITSPGDILEYFQIRCDGKLNLDEKKGNLLVNEEKIVYSCLDSQTKHLDQIADESHLTVSRCMEALLGLELKGYVLQPASHFYVRSVR